MTTFARRPVRTESTVWLVGAAALSIGLGWLLAEHGALVAILPIVTVTAVAFAAVSLQHPRALVLVVMGLLATFPILRLNLAGSLPVYLMDAAVALGIIAVARTSPLRHSPLWHATLLYLALWIPGLIAQMLRISIYLEPVYGFVRQGLAVLAIYLGVRIAQERAWRSAVLTTLSVALIATEILTVLQVAPPTRGVIKSFLIALVPSYAKGYDVYPDRAFALFSAPPTLCAFIIIIFFLLVGGLSYVRGWQRTTVLIALLLAGPALIATYSRGWIFGAVGGLIALSFVDRTAFRRTAAIGAVLVVCAVVSIGTGTLDSSYLDARFSALGTADNNVQLRLARQTNYFDYVQQHPTQALIGEGLSLQDLVARGLVQGREQQELERSIDNGYLLEAYSHGVPAVLVLISVMLGGLALANRGIRRGTTDKAFLSGLSAALASMVVFHMENYMYQAVFMRLTLWLVIGMIVGAELRTRRTN